MVHPNHPGYTLKKSLIIFYSDDNKYISQTLLRIIIPKFYHRISTAVDTLIFCFVIYTVTLLKNLRDFARDIHRSLVAIDILSRLNMVKL